MNAALDCHLGVYSKLIRGHSATGPIKPGTEARMTGKSVGFPDEITKLCQSGFYFENQPPISLIDPQLMPGGAFVYAPVYTNGTYYSVFARIEARSEAGYKKPGRNFVHVAVFAVSNVWHPALIPLAAEILFEAGPNGVCLGDPNFEMQKDRLELSVPQPVLGPPQGPPNLSSIWEIEDQLINGHLSYQSVQPSLSDTPQLDLALGLERFLTEHSYALQGRWLSFALGVSTEVRGHGPGYVFRLDDRPPQTKPQLQRVHFNDTTPPFITRLDTTQHGVKDGARHFDWRKMAKGDGGSTPHRSLLTADNYLESQIPLSGLTNEQLWPADEGVAAEAAIAALQSAEGRAPPQGAAESHGIIRPAKLGAANYARTDTLANVKKTLAQTNSADISTPMFYNEDFALPFAADMQDVMRHSLRYIERRAALYGRYYEELALTEADLAALHRAYGTLLDISLNTFAAEDPQHLLDRIYRLFQHDPIEALGLDGDGAGSLHSLIMGHLLRSLGSAQIQSITDHKSKIERDCKRLLVRSGALPQGTNSFILSHSRVRDFVERFTEISDPSGAVYLPYLWNDWTPALNRIAEDAAGVRASAL